MIRGIMKTKLKATLRRSVSAFRQIVQSELRGWEIERLAREMKVPARKFSCTSQTLLLMLGQFLHLFSLNELVDVSRIHAAELFRVRGVTPARLNTFSHANRTRDPALIERFFWDTYRRMCEATPGFVGGRRKGPLARFKDRRIFAIDSTTIQLAYWCITWASHRQRKAAVKLHMVADVPSRLPHFCVVGAARRHDSRTEDELLASLGAGDVGILDRAYNNFAALHRFHARGGFFVVRAKSGMRADTVSSVPDDRLRGNIMADETIRLTGRRMAEAYPDALRRVTAMVEVNGKMQKMTFLTNNLGWAASTVAELYRARWEVELLFRELKQTLQLRDFFGENENAVKWQIWAALLTHLVLRHLKFMSGANCSYTRFAGIVRAIVWLKKDWLAILRGYGIAPPLETGGEAEGMPYLPGFEKMFIRSMG